VTVKVVMPEMPPAAAVTVLDPVDNPVAVPLALTVAMAGWDEVQDALAEMLCFEPSL